MSDTAIKVEDLSKSYLVGHNAAQRERYTALRDVVARNAKSLARKTRDMVTGRPIVQGDEVEEFWALKDVSFEVKRGEVLGIIGRNGAGKSTLLKILSRITEPTEGRVAINGRVASLLEVGTGFHPELTGRENIYLNGAILGMTRGEIKRKFDEIVAFAEVEKFLDTPVKRYSSGMYVRLAFAVAAHLEPEILVVDEVLAVGDAEFQKKCLGKMQNVAGHGRTVLFVSHNMGAVRHLCTKTLLLERGILTAIGPSDKIIRNYLHSPAQVETSIDSRNDRAGTGQVRITGIKFCPKQSELSNEGHDGDKFEISFKCTGNPRDFQVLLGIYDYNKERLLWLDSKTAKKISRVLPSLGTIIIALHPSVSLAAGQYSANVAFLVNGEISDHLQDALQFEVENRSVYPTGFMPIVHPKLHVLCSWQLGEYKLVSQP